jgi:hypothetical protein
MDRDEIKLRLLEKLGLRVGDHMADYIGRQLSQPDRAFAIMANDARTGVPVRQEISAGDLLK